MKARTRILGILAPLWILLVMVSHSSCGDKNKLAGYYELVSSHSSDWTLQLIIKPGNQYLMTEIEDGREQHVLQGQYKMAKKQIIFEAFDEGKDAVFSFTFANDILTLELFSLGGKTESLPDYKWTFKKK